MKRKIAYLAVVLSVVTTLVLVSCASPATPTLTPSPTATPTLTPTPTSTPTPTPTPAEETPRYGGVFTFATTTDVLGFDEVYMNTYTASAVMITNEGLIKGDWAKGPAGTNLTSFTIQQIWGPHNIGALAESWELPGDNTVIFHLRKGIRWQDKPPANGRELIADDVVFSIKRIYDSPVSYNRINAPEGYLPTSITAPDKYTVIIKVPGGLGMFLEDMSDKQHIILPEVVQKYGDMKDWRNLVGTGPFILKDYTPQSSLVFERNPNYWDKDPVGPGKGNQLPYLDGIKWLVMPDTSTQIAAFRTGKIDYLRAIAWEQYGELTSSNPEIKSTRQVLESPYEIFLRTDTKPFDDIRVRQALMMAVDQEAIKKEYYGGNAEILSCPVMAGTKEFEDIYVPLSELPQSTRELFEYHPDKAKQLLADAGYPNGFKTNVICYSTPAHVDILSIVKADWAKIGVDLTIDPKEYSIYVSIGVGRKHTQAIYFYVSTSQLQRFNLWRTGTTQNKSIISDKRIDDTFTAVMKVWTDYPARNKLLRDTVPYMISQAWSVDLPAPYNYTVWQPWLKNYHGEYSVGLYNVHNFVNWMWLDQELKEKMTGRK